MAREGKETAEEVTAAAARGSRELMAYVRIADEELKPLTHEERLAYLERKLYAGGFDFRFPIQVVRLQNDKDAEHFLQ